MFLFLENGEEGKEGSSDKTEMAQGTTIASRAESLIDPAEALDDRSRQDSEDRELILIITIFLIYFCERFIFRFPQDEKIWKINRRENVLIGILYIVVA